MSCNLNVFLAVSINIYTDKFNLFSGMAFTYNTIPFPNEFTTKLPFYRTTPFLYEIRCKSNLSGESMYTTQGPAKFSLVYFHLKNVLYTQNAASVYIQ